MIEPEMCPRCGRKNPTRHLQLNKTIICYYCYCNKLSVKQWIQDGIGQKLKNRKRYRLIRPF